MIATQILRQEHEGIMKMLVVAETAADQLERGKKVPAKTLAELLEFFQTFADQCHHGKEEELLFPALEAKGVLHSDGPIGVMLTDHERERALIKVLAQATSDYQAGLKGAARQWARAARSYIHLMRGNIYREDNVLFVIAEGLLRPDELDDLAEKFKKLEVERIGRGTHSHLRKMINQMSAKKAA